MNFYTSDKKAVLNEVVSSEQGLTSVEAQNRLEKNGKNKLIETKGISIFKRFMNQLADPMIIILIVAAAVSMTTAIIAKESFADVFIIMFVVILNAVLGVVQESKAEKAIEALKEMTAATSKVLRDGHILQTKSEELTLGDIILLEAGDAVPADVRLIECSSLKIEEAALTGESVPVTKTTEALSLDGAKEITLGDRKNMAYMGSVVVYGRGKAVVVSTGMDTEMGKIATALSKAEKEITPLQQKLAGLSKILTWLVLGVCLFVFAFSLLKDQDFSGSNILDTFMIAVSLAVAAIPEGLAAVVTIVLSIGVTKMSKRNAVIRKLTAVETLGCTQIICSDKTGTLTQNKMTVVDFYSSDKELLASAMSLCSDAENDAEGNAIGEPTECALVNFANSIGLLKEDLKKSAPRIGEAPFDSVRKMMSTVHMTSDEKIIQYTKGAPDELLKICTYYYEDGKILPMNEDKQKEILQANKTMANKALRVLAVAYKEHNDTPEMFEPTFIEKDLTFVGLTGMIDPIRPEVMEAIKKCNSAGIRAIMITGDHKDTAIAIARDLGIITDDSQAITGSQLNDMTDEEIFNNIEKYSVYARVQPEHKVKIVTAWKKKGMVTAMTGDGVNDAPSIKTADIGIGMGITGTDVTKNVADMILADDNFATIVLAVEEGRKIYDNIRKAIQFLLSSNLSEVVSIFTATLFGFVIMKPAQILWINLITDTFPALALGMEKSEPDIMERAPRSSKEGIFSNGVGFDVAYQGFLVAIVTLAAYFIGHRIEAGFWEIPSSLSPDGMTMAFLTMSMAEIFHAFNMRSQRKSILNLKYHNLYLYGAMVISLVLTTAVIYIPVFKNMFEFEAISAFEYFLAMALAITVIPVVELVKLIQRNLINKSHKSI